MEKIIESKSCKQCSISFDITNKDLEFYKKVSPVFNEERYLIPSPKFCPECRQQRRLSWRNERKLYKKECDASWEEIVSLYSPDKWYIVYSHKLWWSDSWDAIDYWREFDFSKGFFDQFFELMKDVPRCATLNWYNENSDYSNHGWKSKDCYLCVWFWNLEDCMYSTNLENCKRVLDSENIFNSEESFYCFNVENVTRSKFCSVSENISDSYGMYNCTNCSFCIWCVNLKWWKYQIFNKQASKEEYDKYILLLGDQSEQNIFLDKFNDFIQKSPQKDLRNIWSNNSNWDLIVNCKNTLSSFECIDCENVKFWYELRSSKNCYDTCVWWENPEWIYEWHCITWNHVLFSNVVWWGNNLYLCDNILANCNDCFGCIGLKNKQYCILNKQYTKEEYEDLVPKIIEKMKKTQEWWEFFPSSLSPFGYNETVASEYFPLSKKEALERWFNWSDYETPFPKVEKIIPASKLPEKIEDIPDDILAWAIECEVTQKPFRIIKPELEFYRKHKLPIPKRHPDQRHLDRMNLRNARKIYERNCDKCEKEIETTYAPERKEIVYCEECYNEAIY